MSSIRIVPTRSTGLTTIVVVLLLPISFLFVSYLFRGSVTIDEPKVVEELAKSLIALVLSLTAIVVSNGLSKQEIKRKSSALRRRVELQLSKLENIVRDVTTGTKLLDGQQLASSSAEAIRTNSENEGIFRAQIGGLITEFERVLGIINSADPEIAIGCSDYVGLLSEGSFAIRQYTTRRSAAGSEGIRLILVRFLAAIDTTK